MAMLVAVSRSRPRSVAKIIKGRNLDVDGCDVPALWVACYNGGLTLTLTLIKPSTNLTLTNPDVNMAQMLIKDYKAQINRFCVTTQSSSLMTASRRGHLKCVLLLLEHGVDVNLTCKPRHFTALMLAAVEGHVEVCRVLLSAGAICDVSTSRGHLTALMLAATRGHNSVVRLLLGSMDKKGVTASSDATSATGSTAFMFSCKYGRKDCATTLLKHNSEICMVSKLGESGLLFALRNKWLNIAKHIIRKEGAANTAVGRSIEYRGQNPLLVAMNFNLKSAAEMLLADHNVDINHSMPDGLTALTVACIKGWEDVARQCIDRGSRVNTRTDRGYSPLYAAAKHQLVALVEVLLDQGAEVSTTVEKEALQGLIHHLKRVSKKANPGAAALRKRLIPLVNAA